ncbi:MAG: JAB domain-containing protein [Bacteroidota bacterium]|nr:JAB domain-containing protein [Bacteroidota bacterium]
MKWKLEALDHEHFWVLFFDNANHALNCCQISRGKVSSTVIDSKIIFNLALNLKASGLMLFHNHSSAKVRPSQSDIELTKKLNTGLKLLKYLFLYNIIIGQNTYFSFADEHLL